MAITAAALQAALGTNPGDIRVLRANESGVGTLQEWYVSGNITGKGVCKWVQTTAADDAATQAAAVTAAVLAH